jgi:hypothetical protein
LGYAILFYVAFAESVIRLPFRKSGYEYRAGIGICHPYYQEKYEILGTFFSYILSPEAPSICIKEQSFGCKNGATIIFFMEAIRAFF